MGMWIPDTKEAHAVTHGDGEGPCGADLVEVWVVQYKGLTSSAIVGIVFGAIVFLFCYKFFQSSKET